VNRAPAIVVSNREHTVTLYTAGQVTRVYPADLSFNWISDKRRSGDGAVPEGRYRVVARKSGAQTRYHKALLLDYPNAEDRRRFDAERRAGTIPASASIGGLIEIHGHGGRSVDWTDGCVAITNPEIDELFARVAIGTPVTVVGGEAPAGLDDFLTSEGPSIGWR